ncbi:MAG: hypothetical protein IT242_11895 [Bacteroidia bacterium]|nr:hypothetical protein [Bacteroidia bacterium]
MSKYFIAYVALFGALVNTYGQEYSYSLNRDRITRIGAYINADTSGFHSSLLPYRVAELEHIMPLDSINRTIIPDTRFYKTWFGRKLRKEHLLQVDKDDIRLAVDPVFNIQTGRDEGTNRNTFINTRGVLVQGDMNHRFYFYSGFRENQARFAGWVDSLVRRDSVVPGQGKVKFLKDSEFDFSQATGGIAYTLNRHFDFQLASDKIFIGDGYRSLLLSDNAYSYPFLKVDMTFWKFRYMVTYAVLQDLRTAHDLDIGYYKKYATFHYLDINIGKKNPLTLGIFEAVIWKQAASRGYELHYLNPFLFLRPVENSLDSPDNELLGMNLRWKITSRLTFYSQVMLDEFLLNEVRAGNGWWGNKQGVQAGVKAYNVSGIKNLNVQTEINWVRPFTYAHRSNSQNYTHYNQPLAHPLGADFLESVSFVNYRWKNLFAEFRIQVATLGRDTGTANLGNDLFKDYDSRLKEYNNIMYQGRKCSLRSFELRLTYLVNASTNFVVEAAAGRHLFRNGDIDNNSTYFTIGIRTSLENYYYDF